MKSDLTDTRIERELVSLVLHYHAGKFRNLRMVVSPDDFTVPELAMAWQACAEVQDGGRAIDMMAVYNAVKAHDIKAADTLWLLEDSGPQGSVADYAITVHTLAVKRTLYDALSRALDAVADGDTAEIADTLAATLNGLRADNAHVARWEGIANDMLLRVQRMKNGEAPEEIPTGFDYIDRRGGLRPGNFDVIAGRTSNGKTAFALAVAMNAAMAGVPVAVYSLEMTNDELATRLGSMLSLVPAAQIDRGPISDGEFTQLFQAVTMSSRAPLIFDRRRTADLDKITASIRQMAAGHGVKVVVLDYLQQLTSTRHRDKRSLISDACVRLKNLAVELGITIIALSQLARENPGGNHRPLMSQLKEAGEIENSADNVYLIYRAELYGETYTDSWQHYNTKGTALVTNSKARSAAIGEFLVGFQPDCVRYYNIDNYNDKKTDWTTEL